MKWLSVAFPVQKRESMAGGISRKKERKVGAVYKIGKESVYKGNIFHHEAVSKND